MAEESYPFATSQVATEDQWSRMARMFCPDGVAMATPSDPSLKVVANGTSSVSVSAGEAMANGFKYRLTAPKALTVPTNFGNASPRVDLVVLRCSQTANSVVATYRTGGTFAPSLAADRNDVFDLPLAQVTVAAGATVAASGAVVDRRYTPAMAAAFGSLPNVYGGMRYDDGSLYVGDGAIWRPVPLGDGPRCRAYQAGTGEVLPTGVGIDLILSNDSWDSANMHATTGDPAVRKVTIPIDGVYDVRGAVAFDHRDEGRRELAIILNGTIPSGGHGSAGSALARAAVAATDGEAAFQCGTEALLSAGDWLSLRATQTSGFNLGTNPGSDRVFLQVRWLGPS